MANKKFSEFVLKTSTSDVSHIVGYNGAENVQITPANFVTTGGTGVFLPLAGGLMVGNTTHNDNVKSIYGSPGNDLQIYHDGSNSYIQDAGTGSLLLKTSALLVRNPVDNSMLDGFSGGAINLYYDGGKKFETTSTGISVTGGGVFSDLLQARKPRSNTAGVVGLSIQPSDTTAQYGWRIDQTTNSLNLDYVSAPLNLVSYSIAGNATFAGLIILPDNKEIKGTTYSSSYLKFAANTELSANDNIIFNANGVEKMRLDSSGNLGVGTSSPAYKLQVAGSVALDVMPGNEQQGIVRIGRYDANTTRYNDIKSFVSATPSSNYLKLAVHGGVENANVNVMTLLGNGNVGVGTSSPLAKLHLDGDNTTASPQKLIKLGSNPSNGNGQYIQFASSSNDSLGSQIQGTRVGAGGSSDLRFLTTSSSSSVLERMRLTSAGDLLVGKSALSTGTVGTELRANGQCVFVADGDNSIDLNRLTNNGAVAVFRQAGTVVGNISVTGSTTSYNETSDYRLKEDLQDFKGLDLVSKIPVYDFKWKTDESRSYGVMAHQLQEVLPQAVSGDKDAKEMQSVDYSKIVPLLVKSIQELSAKLEALECQCEKK